MELHAFRYFDYLDDPFKNLLDLGYEQIDSYEKYIREHKLGCSSTYDINYFLSRIETERRLYSIFSEKGGKPVRKRPHYMILGRCDEWFLEKKQFSQVIAIPLSQFNTDTLSFTYGDSYPTFNNLWKIEQEYRNQVYTYHEIIEIIARYGWPQVWNRNEKFDIENYIEVQVWSDEPIDKYRLCKVEFGNEKFYKHLHYLVLAAMAARYNLNLLLREANPQHEIIFVLRKIAGSKYRNLIIRHLDNIRHNLFVRNHIHGISHCIKVMLLSVFMGILKNLDIKRLSLLIDVSLYHDIGRQFGGNNDTHGILGAEAFKRNFSDFSRTDMKIAMCIIEMHALSDCDRIEPIFEKYSLNNEERETVILLGQCLMDADSLDFVRFGLEHFSMDFLRLSVSKSLIAAAIGLNLLSYQYVGDIISWTKELLFCE